MFGFMLFNKKPGVNVYVHDGRYDIIDKPTFRNRWLAELLMRQGGINESVPDGMYNFNARIRGFKIIMDLDRMD